MIDTASEGHMKKSSLLIILTFIAPMLSACALIILPKLAADEDAGVPSFHEAAMPSYVQSILACSEAERFDEYVDECTDEYYVEHVDEYTDDSVIDFSFSQIVNSTLPPLNFHIVGEKYRDPQVIRINGIIVSDAIGVVIQEIEKIYAWPPDAAEHNLYTGRYFNAKSHSNRLSQRN